MGAFPKCRFQNDVNQPNFLDSGLKSDNIHSLIFPGMTVCDFNELQKLSTLWECTPFINVNRKFSKAAASAGTRAKALLLKKTNCE